MGERPLGVTIIGILWILGGILALLGGLGAFLFGAMIAGPIGAAVGLAIGIFLGIVGIIQIVLGIGCFMAWGWVWTVGVIITILALVLGIVELVQSGAGALIGIAISAIVLWYLFQENVKRYFGKA
ncbi:MAG: hypothetical protein QXL43_02410 [Methanolinea sp.]